MVSCCLLAVISAYRANMSCRFLLKQKFGGLHSRVAVKPALYYVVMQKIRYREQTHALVMGHPATYQLVTSEPGPASRRVEVDGFIEAVGAPPTSVLHIAQVPQRRGGINMERQK